MNRALTLVVHGNSGAGKSWFADTAPAPRLILDAEGGFRFTPTAKAGKTVVWDPLKEPPDMTGKDAAVVLTRDFATVNHVYQWLNSGQHPFRSVVLDSLTEIQKRCVDSIAGQNQMRTQDWGELLRRMEAQVRSFRDLTMHPTTPVEVVAYICMTKDKDGGKRPNIQGSLADSLPYFVDVVGYLFVQRDEADIEQFKNRLLVQEHNGVVAKDRTDSLGFIVDDPRLDTMLETVYAQFVG